MIIQVTDQCYYRFKNLNVSLANTVVCLKTVFLSLLCFFFHSFLHIIPMYSLITFVNCDLVMSQNGVAPRKAE